VAGPNNGHDAAAGYPDPLHRSKSPGRLVQGDSQPVSGFAEDIDDWLTSGIGNSSLSAVNAGLCAITETPS
jgi:hypothetical protein